VSPVTFTDHRNSSLERTLRRYRYTAVYLVAAVTVVLGLLVWDLVEPGNASRCTPQPTSIEKGAR
jgi:hypothetical protein